jgi:hypothetical protein
MVEASMRHFITLPYWFEDSEGGENWPKLTHCWGVRASHALLKTCPKKIIHTAFERKCLELFWTGFLTRCFLSTRPPSPAQFLVLAGNTFHIPELQPKNKHGSVSSSSFMSVSARNRFSVDSEDISRFEM